MKYFYSLAVAILAIYFSGYGNTCLNVKGTIKYDNQLLENAQVTIIRNGLSDTTISTNSKGKFSISLQEGFEYNLVIEKNGFKPQNVLFITEIDNPDNYMWVYKFSTSLLPTFTKEDESYLIEPIALIALNTDTDEFECISTLDEATYSEVEKKYEILLYGNYKNTITKADSAFTKRNYKLAKDLYAKAAILDEYDDYADQQLYMIKKIQSQDIKLNNRYNKLIKTADYYYSNEELLKAKKHYLKAYKIKADPYPKKQISKIKTTIPLKEILTAHN